MCFFFTEHDFVQTFGDNGHKCRYLNIDRFKRKKRGRAYNHNPIKWKNTVSRMWEMLCLSVFPAQFPNSNLFSELCVS